jgi:hypothetical protein
MTHCWCSIPSVDSPLAQEFDQKFSGVIAIPAKKANKTHRIGTYGLVCDNKSIGDICIWEGENWYYLDTPKANKTRSKADCHLGTERT